LGSKWWQGKTTLLYILMEQLDPDGGTFKWGTTISTTYFPQKLQLDIVQGR